MSTRIDYYKASPATIKAMIAAQQALPTETLEARLLELVKIRASQINGCAYCMHMHGRDARKMGIPDEVLDTIAGWHEASWFSPRERAALAWTERLTRLNEHTDDSAIYEELAAQFSEKEQTDLTYAIALINMWNRFGVGFRREPGQ